MASILDLQHSFSLQFMKNGSTAMSIDCALTEIETLFLPTKGFNTNLLLYHVIIGNMYTYSFTCMISHVHRCAPKTVLHAHKNIIYECLFLFLFSKVVEFLISGAIFHKFSSAYVSMPDTVIIDY